MRRWTVCGITEQGDPKYDDRIHARCKQGAYHNARMRHPEWVECAYAIPNTGRAK